MDGFGEPIEQSKELGILVILLEFGPHNILGSLAVNLPDLVRYCFFFLKCNFILLTLSVVLHNIHNLIEFWLCPLSPNLLNYIHNRVFKYKLSPQHAPRIIVFSDRFRHLLIDWDPYDVIERVPLVRLEISILEEPEVL